jgi:tetratricopeptide (TPR) repeat protein
VALLSQSRGGALTFPVVAVVFFAIARDRLRCLVALLLVGGVVALYSTPLLVVFRGIEAKRDPHVLLHRAQHAVVLVFVELLAAGAVWALVDARWRLPARVTVWTGRIVLTLAVVTVLGGAVAAVVVPQQRHKLDHAWHQFTSNELPVDGTAHFSAGLGSNRYDFWRVAANEFRRHPVNGVGVDNFAIDYAKQRKSDEEPLYPHSLELRVVAQTGVIGALLLGAFLVLATLAGLSGRRLGESDASTAAPLALMPFADWLLHGSADWFWELPPLGLLAIGGVALAAALDTRHERIVRNRRRRMALSLATVGAATALFLAALASFAFPLVAQRLVRAAAHGWRADPVKARSRLDRARRLNPLSEQPDLFASEIAGRLKDWPWMNEALRDAIRRDPKDWYSHFELGLVEDVQGHPRAAIAELRRARDLNPREPLVFTALDEIAGGSRVSVAKYDELLVERNDSLAR